MSKAKIISAVRKFFSRRGASVDVQKISKAKADSGFTHVITATKNPERVDELLPFLFPEFEKEGRQKFMVEIPDDFRFCTECGCSENNACLGGCYWVGDMLCSSCHHPEPSTKKGKGLSVLLEGKL
jgi:hypothetical protein